MSEIALKVENLSKLYRIGLKEKMHDTLAGAMMSWFKTPLHNFENLRKLNTFDVDSEANDLIWALRDVSFEVKKGEVLGIIGRNGAGKSTLLKVLSRITEPTSGRVTINGRIASLLEVGTGFHPDLTGRENIYMNGTVLGMKKKEIDRKFDEIVEFSGVEKFLDTPIKRYSSGMKVRLAFAVAAHLEPEVLIIDEVLAVGDAAFQKKCLGKMEDVASHGRTVLFVSHQLGMVRTLCTHAKMMEEGKIAFQGETGEVIDYYSKTMTDSEYGSPTVELSVNETIPAQILRAKLMDQNQEPCLSFDVFDKILLEFEYILRKDLDNISIGMKIVRNGEIFATSFDTDRNPDKHGIRKAGIYKYQVWLPTPLKSGIYQIANLGIGITNVESINYNKDLFTFYVEEKSFDPTFKSYAARRGGVIVADLEWETKYFAPLIMINGATQTTSLLCDNQ